MQQDLEPCIVSACDTSMDQEKRGQEEEEKEKEEKEEKEEGEGGRLAY